MASITRNHLYTVDMDKPLLRQECGILLAEGDNNGDCFTFTLMRGGVALVPDGAMSVTAYFIRQDGNTVFLTGESTGNLASVTLPQACYVGEGRFSLAVKIAMGGVATTIAVLDGYIRNTTTETLLDPGEVIPTLDELFAQITAMEAATAEANTAAAAANEAREGIQDDLSALSDEIKERTDYLSAITGDHFGEIPYTLRTQGNYYREIDGAPVVQGQRDSTGMMLAPKNLCIDFGGDGTARSYIYFYIKNENGEFEVTFAPYKHVADNGIMNYVSSSTMESRMVANIPDGTYMEICRYNASSDLVTLYGWDGEPFGMDVCATPSIPTESKKEAWLSDKGGTGITIHGKAKHIIANGAKLRAVHGYKNGEPIVLNGATKSFYTLPDGYDHFRIRVDVDAEEGKLTTQTGDMRNLVHIVADTSEEIPISNAVKIIENCKRACSLTWKPAKDLVVHNGTTINFKSLISEYNGLIYSSQWDRARIVGWHVSPHTFINAVNDADSIMYNDDDRADNGEGTLAPIYGTVCSAFATMCDGWECPQTNAGFFYDPDIEKYYSHKPQLGQIYTDIKHHCVIPAGITQIDDDSIVSAYEAILPISAKTTRFMSISHQDIWEWWNTAGGLDFYNDYGYVVRNPKATPDMSNVPYADFANATITNGSARPYKGDKSVYTSAEGTVRIDIKDSNATALYLEAEDGSVQQIQIDGASVIDVKPYLLADGIYHVYTDADAVKESFEYVTVTPITCVITDNSIVFSDNDFWYADCNFAGIPYYQNGVDENGEPTYEKRNVSVMANALGDYAKWFATGNKITSVNAIFKQGQYGAYAVPTEFTVEKQHEPTTKYEVIEEITAEETASIFRTKEPDGTPYQFRAMLVIITIGEAASGTLQVYGSANGEYVMSRTLGNIVAGNTAYIEATNLDGVWRLAYKPSSANVKDASTQFTPVSNLLIDADTHPAIDDLCIYGITKGTTIKIMGVRA